MFDPGPFKVLPSGRGEAAILQTSGIIVIKENGGNNIYMQGSGEVFLRPKDIQFIASLLQEWLDAGNEIPAPNTIFPL